MYKLDFTFEYQTIDKQEVLYALDKLAPQIGLAPDDYSQAIEVQKIERGKFSNLSGKVFTQTYCGSNANLKHDYLIITTEGINLESLICFVDLMTRELKALQAFILNSEYNFWQNAQDLMQYKSKGKDYSHLPKTKRDLPPPLNNVIIDTSNNPGRFVLHIGCREFVSSHMWVRASFVKDLKALELIATHIEDSGDLIKVICHSEPFNSPEGMQREIQIKLRKAVYGT